MITIGDGIGLGLGLWLELRLGLRLGLELELELRLGLGLPAVPQELRLCCVTVLSPIERETCRRLTKHKNIGAGSNYIL